MPAYSTDIRFRIPHDVIFTTKLKNGGRRAIVLKTTQPNRILEFSGLLSDLLRLGSRKATGATALRFVAKKYHLAPEQAVKVLGTSFAKLARAGWLASEDLWTARQEEIDK